MAIGYSFLVSRTSLGAAIIALAGVGFVITAVLYWLTLRWIDRHGTWG